MPAARFANPFAGRTPAALDAAALRRLAAAPSRFGPRVHDVDDIAAVPLPAPRPGAAVAGRAYLAHGAAWGLAAVKLVAVEPFLAELAAAPHAAGLQELDLSGAAIGDAGLAILAAAPWFPRLRRLNLAGNRLTDDAVPLLEACSHLESLSLAHNDLRRADLARWPSLRLLSVAGNAGFCGRLPAGLEALDASECGPEIARELVDLPPRLNLAFNDLGDAACATLDFARVRHLSLRGNRLTRLPPLGDLAELDVAVNPLGRTAAAAAALDLSSTQRSDLAFRLFAAADGFARVRCLSLAWNPLSDASLRTLARTPNALESLDLTGIAFTAAGARELVGSPHFERLRSLILGNEAEHAPAARRILAARFGTTTATPARNVAWP